MRLTMKTKKHLLNILLAQVLIVVLYFSVSSVDYITFARDWTGRISVFLLVLSLAFTPAAHYFKRAKFLRPYRRNIGVWGFVFAAVHVGIWVALEYAFDWSGMLNEIQGNTFIIVGLVSFVLMIPLAITSTNGWIRKLKVKKWTVLHTMTYIITPLAIVHHFMAQKTDVTEPIVYGLITLILFYWRFKNVENP